DCLPANRDLGHGAGSGDDPDPAGGLPSTAPAVLYLWQGRPGDPCCGRSTGGREPVPGPAAGFLPAGWPGAVGESRPFLAAPQSNRRRRGGAAPLNPHIDWFLWRPCAGLGQRCPPLARWSDMLDGTYDLTDVLQMHCVMDEIEHQVELARAASN